VRRVPDGFGIDPYQTMLSDLLGPGSVLALCEGREVLLPADPDGRRLSRIHLALGGEPDAGVVALAVAVPGRDLRLVAAIATRDELPDARERALAEAALRGLAGCVRESWCQCQDLDDMTEELTQRYDELSLIYQMERCGIGRAGEDATSLECIRRLLEDAATHLGVPALVAVAPREELELVVHGRDVEPDPDAVEILRARAARAATIGVGEADSGVVAVLRKCEEPDFRSNDRKLLTVLADQASC
jgi:hypothetical protein